ncbi:alpha-amylase family glycosyl hydrolase [Motiliproteus sp. MSK22-1]|uniref:alpha-amylase family glycosyl hydrolase n=1 Tax=Motiliproteus sp. MSK22-1 TaxID=1897630 RepID=UPI000975514D|nr:alpha-amylase family glycosyl hydrolase [Motiliproteus sp. MSK22-1]OMH25742.1 alpha-glucosidase [Motiliproteus sp. MSK22-1]
MKNALNWWKGGIIYQIYPRSFMDSNGDGIGDLPGITGKLDYVADLGVDGIWISPFFTSPMKDFGYDISDYRDVDPIFGTLDDFKALLIKAHDLGLKVMVDLVLSHTSDQHPWFRESRQNKHNVKSDWFVWADAQPDGTPPNNWLSLFGGSAWTWDSRRMQYYLHNFLDSQPDLNFHNSEVREAQLENARFWLDLGVDGFRLDTVNFYYHSQGLENNPPVPGGVPKTLGVKHDNPYAFQLHQYDISRPENLDFLRQLRAVMDQYPGTTTVGEIGADEPLQIMADYTAHDDKLHMAYTFDLLNEPHSAEYIRGVIEKLEAKIGDGWPCWALSNHDVVRSVSRWGEGQDPQAFPRIALAMLMSLRGSVCLYQGEELGLPEAKVPFERIQDPFGLPFWPEYKGRDGCRTPMVWEQKKGGGFSSCQSSIESWLPVDEEQLPLAVHNQLAQPESNLLALRQWIGWRQQQPALIEGDIEIIPDSGNMLCWLRRCSEQQLLVALNMTAETLRSQITVNIQEVLSGHGFTGRVENQEIVLEPYQALFARI